ncbi:diguanylate cyclase domain-containing protein [Thioalkalivibrio sp. ALJ24]|uniref:diguanylate cyclase domain-containing protein n=1 Tax=Thioalkalivibrio sp. ALJ24 TaxID=545276 RepID=UPI00036B331F|nr:diguanylate cyclase [Thioalkalivibrio sp. ALJ24]
MEDESESQLRAALPFADLPEGPIPADWRRVLRDAAERIRGLEASRDYYRQLTDAGQVLIWVAGADGGVEHVNEPWLRFTGRSLVQEQGDGWLEGVHPDDRASCMQSYRTAVAARRPFTLEYRLRRADGEYRSILDEGGPRHGPHGEFLGYVGFCYDITARLAAEQDLRRSLRHIEVLHEALDRLPIAVFVKNRERRYTYGNRETLRVFGCTAGELYGRGDEDFFPSATVARLHEVDSRVLAGEDSREEIETVDEGGVRRFYWEVKTPIYSDPSRIRPDSLLGISTDITWQKDLLREFEHGAHYDALTALPNRVLLLDRLHQAMVRARRRGTQLAVVFLDLDGFKAVNDGYGHDAGDRMLRVVAERMRACLREGDTFARLGGDEFVAVLEDVDPGVTVPLLERLLAAAAAPVEDGENVFRVSASLGVAFYGHDPEPGPEQLLREADQAMYRAKAAGRNRYVISRPPGG